MTCKFVNYHVPDFGHPFGPAKAVRQCLTHGIEAPQPITTNQIDLCLIGKAEEAARAAVVEVSAKLDDVLATLQRIESARHD